MSDDPKVGAVLSKWIQKKVPLRSQNRFYGNFGNFKSSISVNNVMDNFDLKMSFFKCEFLYSKGPRTKVHFLKKERTSHNQ